MSGAYACHLLVEPAALTGPRSQHHVVGEGLTEAGLVQHRRPGRRTWPGRSAAPAGSPTRLPLPLHRLLVCHSRHATPAPPKLGSTRCPHSDPRTAGAAAAPPVVPHCRPGQLLALYGGQRAGHRVVQSPGCATGPPARPRVRIAIANPVETSPSSTRHSGNQQQPKLSPLPAPLEPGTSPSARSNATYADAVVAQHGVHEANSHAGRLDCYAVQPNTEGPELSGSRLGAANAPHCTESLLRSTQYSEQPGLRGKSTSLVPGLLRPGRVRRLTQLQQLASTGGRSGTADHLPASCLTGDPARARAVGGRTGGPPPALGNAGPARGRERQCDQYGELRAAGTASAQLLRSRSYGAGARGRRSAQAAGPQPAWRLKALA